MIDMETLSTDPDCVILTIGAVRFGPYGYWSRRKTRTTS